MGASRAGTSATTTISFSKGAEIGAKFGGGLVRPRHSINAAFYGGTENCTPEEIVNGLTPLPPHKVTMLPQLRTMLVEKCSAMPNKRRKRSDCRTNQVDSITRHTQATGTCDGSSTTVQMSNVSSRHSSVFSRRKYCPSINCNIGGDDLTLHDHPSSASYQSRHSKGDKRHDGWYRQGLFLPATIDDETSRYADDSSRGTSADRDELEWGMRVWSIGN